MAMSLLAQTIDQLSREKGIDPDIIVSALEDAMVVAARKYYRTEEELRSQFALIFPSVWADWTVIIPPCPSDSIAF